MQRTAILGVHLEKGRIIAQITEAVVQFGRKDVVANMRLTDAEKRSPLIVNLDKFLKGRKK